VILSVPPVDVFVVFETVSAPATLKASASVTWRKRKPGLVRSEIVAVYDVSAAKVVVGPPSHETPTVY